MLVLGLVDVPWWGILISLIIIFLLHETRDFDYFKKQGIPGPRPYPIVGTLYTIFTKSLADVESEKFKKYGDRPCFGEFFGTRPSLVVYDEEMLAEVMVKQFSVFTNRNSITAQCGNPLNDGMLFNAVDADWRRIRNEMSPTFTTGKLKKMNTEINRCARILAESMAHCTETDEDVDMKEYAGGFTMDVIASTGFGICVDSQKDRNNTFVDHARRAFVINPKSPVFILILFFPKLTGFLIKLGLTVNFFTKDILDFFTSLMTQAIDMRKSDEDQSRSDFLQLMIKAHKGEDILDEDHVKDEDKTTGAGLTTDEILGNAMLFFIGGYDTTASSISFFMYNMAAYPDVQDKLVQEIKRVVGDKDDIDTSIVQEMPYLDQCVNENLRLYPPVPRVNRRASRDVNIKGVYVRKDVIVNIPILAIHRDPKKWPDPDRFDPDRFSPENRRNRSPYHFIPFGTGPRICIGMRLGLQELKVAIIHTLRKVKVTESHKTKVPFTYDKVSPTLKVKGGIHIKVQRRT